MYLLNLRSMSLVVEDLLTSRKKPVNSCQAGGNRKSAFCCTSVITAPCWRPWVCQGFCDEVSSFPVRGRQVPVTISNDAGFHTICTNPALPSDM